MLGLNCAAGGLRLDFGGETFIDLPALRIAPGTLTLLGGPSGSGKSSLLYLLSGLLLPDAGSLEWAGTDLAGLNERQRDAWRRAHAGFVFQNFHLIEELDPLSNVLVPAWFGHASAAPWRQRAAELLDELGVPRNRASTALLSRGEQQRVAIARALLFDPAIVFADEPTASLDVASGAVVIAALARLAHVEGRTVVVASHDPALFAVADVTIALEHGHPVRSLSSATP